MPAWTNDPSTPVRLLTEGSVHYSAGSKALGPTCEMLISQVAVATNVVTLTVQIRAGNIPQVGDLIYVYKTTQNSGGLNTTTGIAISAVNITASTGLGTISYPKTTANLSIIADAGYAQSTIAEASEVLAAQAYRAFAVQGYGITWSYTCPSAPAAISIQLEGAINNVDSEFATIGTAQTSTSGTEVIATLPAMVRFVRPKVASTSGGTNPSIIIRLIASRITP